MQSLTYPLPPGAWSFHAPISKRHRQTQPTTRELANVGAELTQTQPPWLLRPDSSELCSLPDTLSWEVRGEAGERLGSPGLLSGRTAPARTGGGPGRSPWTRSMDAQGQPWLRSAGWGRTARVAVEEAGGKRLSLGAARPEEELPSRPQGAGPKLQSICLQTRTMCNHYLPALEPVLAAPGIWGQRTSSRPAWEVIPISCSLEAESVCPLPT